MGDIKSLILVVDDEPQIRKMLKVTLEASDYRLEEAENGKQALRMAASVKPDIILLDLGLPDLDGTEVIRQLREWSATPVIVVSVRDGDKDIAAALDLGADDYMTKPFSVDVLLARIRSNLRKAIRQEGGEPELVNGPIRLDQLRHEVTLGGDILSLSPKEYELLRYFMTHKGRMLTHRQILSEIWGPAHVEDVQYLRVYVGQLRQKIEPDPESPRCIVTEPGIGYRMEGLEE
jgi:two-component system KDP operon response regulator KdpE